MGLNREGMYPRFVNRGTPEVRSDEATSVWLLPAKTNDHAYMPKGTFYIVINCFENTIFSIL